MMRRIFQLPIKAYRLIISPLLPPSCRFQPSCSDYAIGALEQHGVFRGGLLTAKRLLRCHPWGASGFDPVPTHSDRADLHAACPDKGCASTATELNTQHTHLSGH